MATVAISGLVALAAASRQQDDLIPIVDVHDFTQGPSGSLKKITVANLFTDVSVSGTLAATGAITAASFSGVGTALTALNASNLTSGNISAARVVGAYTNITQVGNLVSLSLSGAITGATNGTFSGTVFAALFSGSGANITSIPGSAISSGTIAGARLTGNYSGITGVGTLGLLTVSTPINADLSGNADTATLASAATVLATPRTINGVSFNGSANVTVPAAAGTLTGATLAAGVTASSLTSVGTLTLLVVAGLLTAGKIKGGGSAPTVVAAGGTATIAGTDTACEISFTPTGTDKSFLNLVVTYSAAFATIPFATACLSGPNAPSTPFIVQVNTTTGGVTVSITAATAVFVVGTQYQFTVHSIA